MPPDYKEEWRLIIPNVVLTSILFLLVLPSFIKSLYNMEKKDLGNEEESLNESSLAGVKGILDESRSKIISATTTTKASSSITKSNTRYCYLVKG